MTRVQMSLAGPADDDDLRRFLRDSPSGGVIRLSIEKEPSYFAAFEVEGDRGDALVGRERGTGRLVGLGTRSEKPCLINGAAQPQRLGYLSNLRLAPEHRNGMALARGYREFRQLHRKGSVSLYLTTIMADNAVAKRVLTSGRAGLPTYRYWGLYRTFVMAARRNPWRSAKHRHVSVRRAGTADVGRIVRFLRREGRRRQFFPAYSEEDLLSNTGLLRGLQPSDIYIAEDEDGICGTTALWCQRDFRQWVVNGYGWPMSLLRRPHNLLAQLLGRPELPPAGRMLDYRFLALVCARGDRPEPMEALWGAIWGDLQTTGAEPLVVIGLHERDPLTRLLAGKPTFELRSRLYVVHWEDGAAACADLDDSVPYLEVGSI